MIGINGRIWILLSIFTVTSIISFGIATAEEIQIGYSWHGNRYAEDQIQEDYTLFNESNVQIISIGLPFYRAINSDGSLNTSYMNWYRENIIEPAKNSGIKLNIILPGHSNAVDSLTILKNVSGVNVKHGEFGWRGIPNLDNTTVMAQMKADYLKVIDNLTDYTNDTIFAYTIGNEWSYSRDSDGDGVIEILAYDDASNQSWKNFIENYPFPDLRNIVMEENEINSVDELSVPKNFDGENKPVTNVLFIEWLRWRVVWAIDELSKEIKLNDSDVYTSGGTYQYTTQRQELSTSTTYSTTMRDKGVPSPEDFINTSLDIILIHNYRNLKLGHIDQSLLLYNNFIPLAKNAGKKVALFEFNNHDWSDRDEQATVAKILGLQAVSLGIDYLNFYILIDDGNRNATKAAENGLKRNHFGAINFTSYEDISDPLRGKIKNFSGESKLPSYYVVKDLISYTGYMDTEYVPPEIAFVMPEESILRDFDEQGFANYQGYLNERYDHVRLANSMHANSLWISDQYIRQFGVPDFIKVVFLAGRHEGMDYTPTSDSADWDEQYDTRNNSTISRLFDWVNESGGLLIVGSDENTFESILRNKDVDNNISVAINDDWTGTRETTYDTGVEVNCLSPVSIVNNQNKFVNVKGALVNYDVVNGTNQAVLCNYTTNKVGESGDMAVSLQSWGDGDVIQLYFGLSENTWSSTAIDNRNWLADFIRKMAKHYRNVSYLDATTIEYIYLGKRGDDIYVLSRDVVNTQDFKITNVSSDYRPYQDITGSAVSLQSEISSNGDVNVSGLVESNGALMLDKKEFVVIPSSDSVYVNISNWTNKYKKWNISSDNSSLTVDITIGDWTPDENISVNASPSGWNKTYTSNSTGFINFTYDGEFSQQKQIFIAQDANPPVINIDKPGNTTISDNTPELSVTTDETADIWYNIDGRDYNVTLAEDVTWANETIKSQFDLDVNTSMLLHMNEGEEEFALDANSVTLLHMNEGFDSQVYDSSTYGNNGTIYEANWTASGKFGYGLEFDGEDDYVEVDDSSSLDITDEITIEAWIYPNEVTGNNRLVSKENTYWLRLTNGKIDAGFTTTNGFIDTTNYGSISPGSWYHVAVTFNGTEIRFYINGNNVGTQEWDGSIVPSTYDLQIGTWTQFDEYFDGKIDEVHILNRTLSDEEIKEAANVLNDSSTNNNDGAVYGATVATGKFGYGLEFDGEDDYVEVDDSSSLDITDNITIEAWIYPNDVNGKNRLVSKQNTYWLRLINGKIDAGFTNDTGQIIDTNDYGSISPGNWYHVAVTLNGTDIMFYINGNSVGTEAWPGGSIDTSTYDLQIGTWTQFEPPEYFNGTIDEVHILDRALNQTEILREYEKPLENGSHYIEVYANDSFDNIGSTGVWFTVGAALLEITIISPPNETITDTTPDLNLTVSELANTTYNWNGEGNITGCQNCTSYNTTYGEATPDANTSLLLHLNENHSNTVYDDSGTGNDGTIIEATWTAGRYGYALDFDGNDYVNVSDDDSLDPGTDNFTIMAWIKTGSVKGFITNKLGNWDDRGPHTWINKKGKFAGMIHDTGTDFGITSTTLLNDSMWHHVAFVVNWSAFPAGTAYIYVDGVQEKSTAITEISESLENNKPVVIGSALSVSSDYNFTGKIDDVHIIRRALNATEILDYSNRTLKDGQHNVTVYAKDESDNQNSTTKWFSVLT